MSIVAPYPDAKLDEHQANPAFRQSLYNLKQMAASTLIELLSERVDRLLLRHDELQRTNALLQQQVMALAHERDMLKQQHVLAQQRLDALLARLPEQQEDQA